jgi:hypothetical protein
VVECLPSKYEAKSKTQYHQKRKEGREEVRKGGKEINRCFLMWQMK